MVYTVEGSLQINVYAAQWYGRHYHEEEKGTFYGRGFCELCCLTRRGVVCACLSSEHLKRWTWKRARWLDY